MDFIEELPRSGGKSTILIVVNRLSKFAHFIALSHPFTAKTAVATFIDQICKLYGMAKTIVSVRDALFTSLFGENSGTYRGLNSNSVLPIIHNLMARLRWSIGPLKLI